MPLLFALLYGGGYVAQFIRNYNEWQSAGGTMGDGSSPATPRFAIGECFKAMFTFPYGIIGILFCISILGLLIFMVMKMGYGDKGEYDRSRNLIYSTKGTYGTAGFMPKKEMTEVLDLVGDVKKHGGTILGKVDGKAVCVPRETRLNSNIAVYGASGSMKTRAFCVNRILQSAARGESIIITDPKSELYEKTSEYLRSQGYEVKVL